MTIREFFRGDRDEDRGRDRERWRDEWRDENRQRQHAGGERDFGLSSGIGNTGAVSVKTTVRPADTGDAIPRSTTAADRTTDAISAGARRSLDRQVGTAAARGTGTAAVALIPVASIPVNQRKAVSMEVDSSGLSVRRIPVWRRRPVWR